MTSGDHSLEKRKDVDQVNRREIRTYTCIDLDTTENKLQKEQGIGCRLVTAHRELDQSKGDKSTYRMVGLNR